MQETKKTEKNKYSLSLNRNNATRLSEVNLNPTADTKENAQPGKVPSSCHWQGKAQKRPFNSTYFNTLNAAKKLKTVTELQKPTEVITEPKAELVVLDSFRSRRPLLAQRIAMLNGDHASEQYESNGKSAAAAPAKKMPVATLSNLGNTCFLNSVLYTLRYAPRFLHNLHHLVSDLSSVEQKLGSIRMKSSSLGRSAAGLASSGTRSWSSKDLLSLGQNDSNTGKSKIQIATERLHETYVCLRAAESKSLGSGGGGGGDAPEPFAADAFLSALREVNSTFEGNRQQDAHELLICILNTIRETCRALQAQAQPLQPGPGPHGDSNGLTRQPSLESDSSKPTLGNLRKSWKKKRQTVTGKAPEPTLEQEPAPGWDFVQEDFEGVMVMRTTCMECETVREHRQAVCDVCVPVSEDGEPDRAEPFRAAALAAECLRDQNKYWCSVCLRYVEARRGAAYARLPRLLVLQLKRFSGGMQKITRHAPTPRHMPCFCEPCNAAPPRHRYNLWAVIMHLGQTLTGGHYVAYARDTSTSEAKCERDGEGDAPSSHQTGTSFMKTLFNRPRPPQQVGCAARACCVPRRAGPRWLACDDELVRPLTDDELDDLLSAEPRARSAATPYLLFYVQTDIG